MTILDEEEFVASALVYPGSTEEVQKVVRWANKHLIPIFPISMGRNRMCSPQTTLSLAFQCPHHHHLHHHSQLTTETKSGLRRRGPARPRLRDG